MVVINYTCILPPFKQIPFYQMKKRDAQQYLDWFISALPAHLDQLRRLLDETGYDSSKLDYTDESIIYLWRWYLEHVELPELTEEEIRKYCEEQTAWLMKTATSKGGIVTELNQKQIYDHYHDESPTQKIILVWQLIAMDIGNYLGEFLIKKHHGRGLYWGFITSKRSMDQYKPVIRGLQMRMVDSDTGVESGITNDYQVDPIISAHSVALGILKGIRDDTALLQRVRIIEEWIYNLHSPRNIAEIRCMSESQAHNFFTWYYSMIPHNIEILRMRSLQGPEKSIYTNKTRIDYSVESLGHIWSWYLELLDYAGVIEQKKREKNKIKKLLHSMVVDGVELYEGFHVRALDISMYFAEVFRRHHANKGIKWGYVTEPKSLPYVNRPVLTGFRDPNSPVMDQIGIFSNLAVRVAQGDRNKNALIDLYNEWEKKV